MRLVEHGLASRQVYSKLWLDMRLKSEPGGLKSLLGGIFSADLCRCSKAEDTLLVEHSCGLKHGHGIGDVVREASLDPV